MISRLFVAGWIATCLAGGYGHASAQASASNSPQATDATTCDVGRAPQAFDGKLLRIHAYLSRGFEDSTLHDPSCPEEALVNMGDPSGWPAEIWAEFADRTDYWKVSGFAPLIDDERLRQFRALLLERGRVHQMTAATMIGTFYAGRTNDVNGRKADGPGYGHLGCCSLFVISRIESTDTEYSKGLNYSSGDWSVDLPNDCGSEKMLGLPPNATIRSWQQEADHGKDLWHYDPRQTAEHQLRGLRSGAFGSRTAGTVQRLDTKKSKVKPSVDELPSETLTELPSSTYVKRYAWIEADHVTRYVIAVARPYWLVQATNAPSQIIWAPAASSVLGCAAH